MRAGRFEGKNQLIKGVDNPEGRNSLRLRIQEKRENPKTEVSNREERIKLRRQNKIVYILLVYIFFLIFLPSSKKRKKRKENPLSACIQKVSNNNIQTKIKRNWHSTATKRTKKRKIAVLGLRAVGKSSTAIRFVDDHFQDMYHPTIRKRSSRFVAKNIIPKSSIRLGWTNILFFYIST